LADGEVDVAIVAELRIEGIGLVAVEAVQAALNSKRVRQFVLSRQAEVAVTVGRRVEAEQRQPEVLSVQQACETDGPDPALLIVSGVACREAANVGAVVYTTLKVSLQRQRRFGSDCLFVSGSGLHHSSSPVYNDSYFQYSNVREQLSIFSAHQLPFLFCW